MVIKQPALCSQQVVMIQQPCQLIEVFTEKPVTLVQTRDDRKVIGFTGENTILCIESEGLV